MPDPKTPSIPSWQLAANRAAKTQEDTPPSSPNESPSADKETLLEQASQFLQDESIRNAPTDQKTAFLESKGLKQDDIKKLLGVSTHPEAAEDKKEEPAATSPTSEEQFTSSKKPTSESPPISSSSTLQQNSAPTRDIPPIITYPEFLAQASKPPPLVSLQTVLYTLYGAAGLASTMYGASEFLIKPMIASLTGARHELAETAQRNLETLNEKLELNVSTIPPAAMKSRKHASSDEGEAGEADSITSDPTELFHRDIATQTSPELENPPSTLPKPDSLTESQKALDTHVSRLSSISSQLNDILYAEMQNDLSINNVKDRISNLQTYLDSLAYSSPSYLSSSLYGTYGDDSKGDKQGMSSGEADAIAAFRAEVRSAKGVLLSARNFPAGVRGGVRGMTRSATASQGA
ncbi:Peroxisomal membrane anchor family protein [Coccidioides posadasii C735 delta SOWgp]|uniref:Peroxisomal membrane protein PEX14 n=1 Tax=Coccidioides posadasii (strain C735) TaxID=222929 RepID=C5P0A2_COCP7|nr:Peroxisomal membrane anchor family protein [Coccidioides posadasii C735 delta SOWgp]EER29110.1 Peroxisomal membrane anchor family protein [Coccidioides posadasii C735 delta SOWgp]|eukprot:XP_003071255.1 Peroxisomal membrane anchor family protein [Coccidioides posadasii C735 delta SOWgp]